MKKLDESSYCCVITGKPTANPYVDAYGNCYDGPTVLEWIKRFGVSPVTGLPITAEDVAPNPHLRKEIEKRFKKRVTIVENPVKGMSKLLKSSMKAMMPMESSKPSPLKPNFSSTEPDYDAILQYRLQHPFPSAGSSSSQPPVPMVPSYQADDNFDEEAVSNAGTQMDTLEQIPVDGPVVMEASVPEKKEYSISKDEAITASATGPKKEKKAQKQSPMIPKRIIVDADETAPETTDKRQLKHKKSTSNNSGIKGSSSEWKPVTSANPMPSDVSELERGSSLKTGKIRSRRSSSDSAKSGESLGREADAALEGLGEEWFSPQWNDPSGDEIELDEVPLSYFWDPWGNLVSLCVRPAAVRNSWDNSVDGVCALALIWYTLDVLLTTLPLYVEDFQTWLQEEDSVLKHYLRSADNSNALTALFVVSGYLVARTVIAPSAIGSCSIAADSNPDKFESRGPSLFYLFYQVFAYLTPSLLAAVLVAMIYGALSSRELIRAELFSSCATSWWTNVAFITNFSILWRGFFDIDSYLTADVTDDNTTVFDYLDFSSCYTSLWAVSCGVQMLVIVLPLLLFYLKDPGNAIKLAYVFLTLFVVLRSILCLRIKDIDAYSKYIYYTPWGRVDAVILGAIVCMQQYYFLVSIAVTRETKRLHRLHPNAPTPPKGLIASFLFFALSPVYSNPTVSTAATTGEIARYRRFLDNGDPARATEVMAVVDRKRGRGGMSRLAGTAKLRGFESSENEPRAVNISTIASSSKRGPKSLDSVSSLSSRGVSSNSSANRAKELLRRQKQRQSGENVVAEEASFLYDNKSMDVAEEASETDRLLVDDDAASVSRSSEISGVTSSSHRSNNIGMVPMHPMSYMVPSKQLLEYRRWKGGGGGSISNGNAFSLRSGSEGYIDDVLAETRTVSSADTLLLLDSSNAGGKSNSDGIDELLQRLCTSVVLLFFVVGGIYWVVCTSSTHMPLELEDFVSEWQYRNATLLIVAVSTSSLIHLGVDSVVWPLSRFLNCGLWFPLASLSYPLYLALPVVTAALLANTSVPSIWTGDFLDLLYDFSQLLIFALIAALLLSLLIERPLAKILFYLAEMRARQASAVKS